MANAVNKKIQKVTCRRCGHIIKKRTKGVLIRCSQCSAYMLLKKFPDERKLRTRKNGKSKKRKQRICKPCIIPKIDPVENMIDRQKVEDAESRLDELISEARA